MVIVESIYKSAEFKKLMVEARKVWYNCDQVMKTLYGAYKMPSMESNVILYGKGGYGKSAMAKWFLDYVCKLEVDKLKEEYDKAVKALKEGESIEEPDFPTVFKKAFGGATKVADMFGGYDMKKIADIGEFMYMCENSFMNSRFVLIDEIFDAPAKVLEEMKDPISDKLYNGGGYTFEVKTHLIIGCTNRSPEEIETDQSMEALSQRFPVSLEVMWKDHSAENYNNYLQVCFPNDDKALINHLAELFVTCNEKTGETLNPRLAKGGYKSYKLMGMDGLLNRKGFNDDVIKKLKRNEKEMLKHAQENAKWIATKESLYRIVNNDIPTKSTANTYLAMAKSATELYDFIEKNIKNVKDEHHDEYRKLKGKLMNLITNLQLKASEKVKPTKDLFGIKLDDVYTQIKENVTN